MAENSAIEWTDATVNFWWGCTKVGPGCEHCYAETWSKRTGGGLWGVGAPRRRIKGAVALILKLHNSASWFYADHDRRRRVFVQSMSDLFDLEVPIEWFAEAWHRIAQCSSLQVQIVTKRVSVVEKRLAAIGATGWPGNAGLIISVTDQIEADRDVPRLLALKAKLGIPWVGLSMEPLLGPVDIRAYMDGCYECGASCGLRLPSPPKTERCVECEEECGPDTEPVISEGCPKCGGELEFICPHCDHYMVYQHPDTPVLDWVIVGGESGPGARPMHQDWARSLRDQCAVAGVPFLFKQWGEWAPGGSWYENHPVSLPLRAIGPGGWTDDGLTLADAPGGYVARVGKKAAGRLLDGVQHDGMPA